MAGLQDIVIKLKPEVDTKNMDKDLKRASESTAAALNKTIQDFENSTQQAIKSIASDIESLDKNAGGSIFERANDAVATFKNRLAEIEKSNSIDTLTLKLYNFERAMSIQAKNILSMQSAFEQLSKTKVMEDMVNNTYGSLDKAKEKVTELRTEANALMRSLQEQGIQKAGPSIMGPMDEQMQKIQQVRESLRALKQGRKDLESSPTAGTSTWIKEVEDLDTKIKKTTSDLALLMKDFYKMGRNAGWTGNNKDIMATYEQVSNMRNLYEEANNLSAAIKEIQNNGGKANEVLSTIGRYSKGFEQSADAIHRMAEEVNKVNENVQKTEGSAKSTGASFNQWRNVVWSASRVLGNFYTISLDIYRGARRIANMYMKIWNTAEKVLGAMKQWSKHITGVANEHAQSFKKMLKDILRYSLGIRSLFMLFRRLRKYIKEAFTEMANQIPAVNAMLASLKSSLYALKGSLATAFEPILSAIAPALVRLIDLLAQAVTYIGMFFAALTGRGFVYQAKKVAQTIGDAAGKAKKLNKQLQGFDELNNLTTSKGSGGGKDDTPLAKFEKVDVPDWIKNLADKTKQLWNDIMDPIRDAWAKVGDYVVDAWKRAFYNVKALLSDIVRDFVKAWQSGLGELIATRFFEIIGDIGNIIANIADRLREAWNANDNGLKIWTAILTIVEKILTGIRNITIDMVKWTNTINLTPAMTAFKDWLESLIPIVEMIMNILFDIWNDALKPILNWAFDGENSGIAKFFNILKDFNDKLDTEKIRQDLDLIRQAIGRFIPNIGDGLLIFMDRMLGYLADWLNSDDFTQWCQDVADWLDSLDPVALADDLEQVWRIIKNIAKEVWNAIKFVIEHKADILDTLEWASEHIKEIAAVFLGGKLVIDSIRLLANIALLKGAIGKAGGLKGLLEAFKGSKLLKGVGNIGKSIGDAFKTASLEAEISGAGSLAGQIFLGDFTANVAAGGVTAGATIAGAIIGGLAAAFGGYAAGNKLGEWLFPDDKELYEQYRGFEGFGKMMIDLWDAIKYSVGEAGKAISEAFSNAKDWVVEKWEGLADWFKGTWENIAEWFKINVTQPISMMFSDAWQFIKDTWQGIKEFFAPLGEAVAKIWEGVTSRVSKFFEGCWLIIQAVWKVVSEWFYNNVISPLISKWETFKAKVEELWNKLKDTAITVWGAIATWITTNVIEPLIEKWEKFKDKILEVWEKITSKAKEVWEALKKFVEDNVIKPLQDAWQKFSEAVQKAWTAITDKVREIWTNVCSWLQTNIISPIQEAWRVCTEAIGKFFDNLWEGIKSGAKGAINWVLTRIETAINGMIDTINGFFGLFNHVVSWAADIMDEDWSGIEPIGHIHIPKLAKGAVIPPNNEFLAVLGDQKRGTNIESPLSTMVEAFNMANKGGSEQEIALLQEQNELLRQLLQKEFGISESNIYRSVRNQDRIYRNSTGRSAFAY